MDRRFELRFQELMEEAVVPPVQLDGLLNRLEQFVVPFSKSLNRIEGEAQCHPFSWGSLGYMGNLHAER